LCLTFCEKERILIIETFKKRFESSALMSDADKIAKLEKSVADLERKLETVVQNANIALTGHATILGRLVDYTKFVPAAGKKLSFPRVPVDVSRDV
jgi:hypothetical protein